MQNLSPAQLFASLPPDERDLYLSKLSPQVKASLRFYWPFWARPSQLLPQGSPWTYWMIMAGRGYGKTRTGAETVRQWIKVTDMVNLIGATSDDARDIMVEGESGILAICPNDERPTYKKSERKLIWPNGATSLIFTADEPERLRGKQHKKLWADELGAWRYPDAWDQAMFGLRLGDEPQAVVTTTPRPVLAIRELLQDTGTVVSTGTTYENRSNLAPTFFSKIIQKYEGTRLGRQELRAELLDDLAGALWKRSMFDKARVREAPVLSRIVIAVDPSGTKGVIKSQRSARDELSTHEGSNDVGIVVVGLGKYDKRGYVLADLSCNEGPQEWGKRVVDAYHHFQADRVVAEVNFGGAMVEHVVMTAAVGSGTSVAYKEVTASRGKVARAEPVAMLYEQSRVSHVSPYDETISKDSHTLSALEDQLCLMSPEGYAGVGSPDRADALVWGLTELMVTTALPLRVSDEILRNASMLSMRSGGMRFRR